MWHDVQINIVRYTYIASILLDIHYMYKCTCTNTLHVQCTCTTSICTCTCMYTCMHTYNATLTTYMYMYMYTSSRSYAGVVHCNWERVMSSQTQRVTHSASHSANGLAISLQIVHYIQPNLLRLLCYAVTLVQPVWRLLQPGCGV